MAQRAGLRAFSRWLTSPRSIGEPDSGSRPVDLVNQTRFRVELGPWQAAVSIPRMLLIYTAAIALLLVPVQASSTGIVRALACSDGTAVPSPEYYPGLVSDCEALLLAKPTLEGSGPVMLDWSSTTDIRSWRGITVTGTPPRVTAVNCRRLRLEGTVPTQLGDLSNLAELNLAANDLKGTGPAPARKPLQSQATVF